MRTVPLLCFLVLVFLTALMLPFNTLAGPVSTQGTEFWLTFPTQYLAAAQTLVLSIVSPNNANGQLSIPGLSYTAPFSVTANSAVTLVIPSGAMLTALDGVQDLGIHVTANTQISVFGLEYELRATDGYLALPVGAIGTNYWVASYTADTAQSVTMAIGSSEFAVVASQDSTSVTIIPAVTVGTRAAGTAYTVALNQGQAYQLQATVPSADLTGTQVTSNYPVALFGANGCADVPSGFIRCNMLVEQEIPLSTWGTAFITVPLAGRNGDTFRCLSSANGTVVSVNGVAVVTLNQGQFIEQMASVPTYVTATAPILLMQYSNSNSYDNASVGDPSQITVPPVSNYGTAYQTVAPFSGFSSNFLNVAAPTAAVGSILLDGAALPAGAFTAVGSSGFSSAQVTIGTGFHQLSGSQPFGVESYGFDVYDAYGYPAGMIFPNLPTLTPSPTPTPTLTPTITPTPTPICETHVWPNPFNPQYAFERKLKVDCLQPGDEVSFFTLAGELVYTEKAVADEVKWDGHNQKDTPVAPGVYFYVIQRGGTAVKRGKILVVRQ